MTARPQAEHNPVHDLLRVNRLAVAAAYRRLADQALRACEQYSDELNEADEQAALRAVLGRVDDVKHARVIYNATRQGAARVQRRKGTAA